MARPVPIPEYEPQVPVQEGLRRIIPSLNRESIGPGLEAIGSVLDQKQQADAATEAGNKLADARLKIMQSVEQAKQTAAPGAAGYFNTVKDIVEGTQRDTLSSASSPLVKRHLAQGFNNLRVGFGDEALRYEAAQGVEYRFASTKDSADKLALIAAQHPEQYADLMGQALAQVNGARLTPDRATEAGKYAQSVLAKSAVLARAQADPYGTMKSLLSPEDADPAIQALNPQERQILVQHADGLLHQRVADAERIESLQDRAERKTASSALTSLIVKSRSPEGITTQDVLRVAPLFSHEPAALEAALALAGGKTVSTDVQQFAPRYLDALRGVDQSEWALAHVGRDLSQADFEKIVGISDKGVPNPIKAGAEAVNGFFRQGPFDRWDPAFESRKQNAIFDYYQWAQQNPNATMENAREAASTITAKWSQLDKNIAMPPRFLVGTPQNPDLDATSRNIFAAEQSGAISHAEAVKQLGQVASMRRLLETQAAARAKAKPQ